MKKIISAVLFSVGAACAGAAEVDLTSVTGEFRSANAGNQYKAQADFTVSSAPKYSFYGEVETMRKHGARKGDSVNMTLGVNRPMKLFGYSVTPYAQVGDKFQDYGQDTTYAGVGVKVAVPVQGKLSAEVSYRRRFDLWGAEQNEDRVSLFAKYAVKTGSISAGLHNYSGTSSDKRWAIAYTHKL